MDITNKDGEYKEGSISSNHEPDSGLGAAEDDEDLCFDIDLDARPDSEVRELQFSFSVLPVHELCVESQAIPMSSVRASDAERQERNNHECNTDGSVSPKTRRTLSCREFRTSIRLTEPRPSLDAGTAHCHQIYAYDRDRNESPGKLDGQGRRGARMSSKVTTVLSSSFMRFLIKRPSEKIRSILMSAVLSYRYLTYKSMPQKKSKTSSRSEDTSWSVGTRGLDVRSCPGSVASSPYRRGVCGDTRVVERERSISAAIAHCKLSFDSRRG